MPIPGASLLSTMAAGYPGVVIGGGLLVPIGTGRGTLPRWWDGSAARVGVSASASADLALALVEVSAGAR